MDNFIHGTWALMRSLSLYLHMLTEYQVLWGFVIGFFVAVFIQIFILTENPKHLPTLLIYNAEKSFEKLNQENQYHLTRDQHSKLSTDLKLTTTTMFSLFFIIVLISMLRF